MASIYRHINKTTGETFYIGITINNRRPYSKCDRNKFWHNIVSKYEYEVEVLKSDLTLSEAKELEEILIDYFGRRDLGNGTLVNLTNGGELNLGRSPSRQTRLKLSKSKIGIPRDEETKKRISDTMMGVTRSGKHLEKPIICINLKNKEKIEFKSIKDCADKLGLNRPSISKVLNGNLNRTKHYTFIWQV